MIILLAGTLDGRTIAGQLTADGHTVLITAVSDYGGLLAAESGAEVLVKALSAEELADLITSKQASTLIDCTHPYACEITKMAQRVARHMNIQYIRYERPSVQTKEVSGNVYFVDGWAEAAEQAANLGDVIFLTTGSRNLPLFLQQEAIKGKRIVARVLPEAEVISLCRSLGMLPRDIIAMQGPFSYEMNKTMFTDYGAQVVVTKEAGQIGGTDTKLAAARDLGIPVVVVGRPQTDHTNVARNYAEIKQMLHEAGRG